MQVFNNNVSRSERSLECTQLLPHGYIRRVMYCQLYTVPEYHITTPRHVTGSRISRKRRSVTSMDTDVKDDLEYRIHMFGENHHLVLKHNQKLMSPGISRDKIRQSKLNLFSLLSFFFNPDGKTFINFKTLKFYRLS